MMTLEETQAMLLRDLEGYKELSIRCREMADACVDIEAEAYFRGRAEAFAEAFMVIWSGYLGRPHEECQALATEFCGGGHAEFYTKMERDAQEIDDEE